MGCSVAADGQIMVDYEDEFDEFGDSKCSLCQRRFEEQGKILPFDNEWYFLQTNKRTNERTNERTNDLTSKREKREKRANKV